MAQVTQYWTPTYGLWRTAIRRTLFRSPLFWIFQALGVGFLLYAIVGVADVGPGYLTFVPIAVLLLGMPELQTVVVLRERQLTQLRRLSCSDDSLVLETSVGRTEYRWQAVGWVWHGRDQVVVTRAVRIRPLFIAVVPDTAFVSDAQRRDLLDRSNSAARRNGSQPESVATGTPGSPK